MRRHVMHMALSMLASVVFAVFIVYTGVIHSFIESTQGFAQVGAFVAGLFFTSILTTAPAIVVLGELALEVPLWSVAAVGALGAVCGDYILFWLVRDGVSGDVTYLLKHSRLKRWGAIFRTRLFHRLLPLFGALVIASPLPDELGLTLLGFSKIGRDRFLLISYGMNFLGILGIGLIARSVV